MIFNLKERIMPLSISDQFNSNLALSLTVHLKYGQFFVGKRAFSRLLHSNPNLKKNVSLALHFPDLYAANPEKD